MFRYLNTQITENHIIERVYAQRITYGELFNQIHPNINSANQTSLDGELDYDKIMNQAHSSKILLLVNLHSIHRISKFSNC